jgi:hypothetical protein
MVDEAEEMKPPNSDVRPDTRKVDEALSGPATVSGPFMVDEAEEMKPDGIVKRPEMRSVLETLSGPATVSGPFMVDEAPAIIPPFELIVKISVPPFLTDKKFNPFAMVFVVSNKNAVCLVELARKRTRLENCNVFVVSKSEEDKVVVGATKLASPFTKSPFAPEPT